MSAATRPSTRKDLPPNLRPRDAATLIVIDRSVAKEPRILMGRRAMHHAFMPGAYVFPGGRVDRNDSTMATADGLAPALLDKLLIDMKRGASEQRARALALAAIRETWEEVGIMLGTRCDSIGHEVPGGWESFGQMKILPRLSDLHFIGRAITPPRRARRFDTRFFAAFADAIAHSLSADRPPTDELEDVCWLTFDEARKTDLPGVTARMIGHLEDRLADDPELDAAAPVPYYFSRHGKLHQMQI